jgi:uncharacterized protein YprB with RNaseH-like and TPR domain
MSNQDLRERLRRLGIHQGVQAVTRPRRRRKPIEALIPGEIVRTSRGSFFLHSESFPCDHCHGAHSMADLLRFPRDVAARLARDERLAIVDPTRIAFIDTETTGLAGGTGTYVFLVGVGTFEAGGFIIRQFFMRDFDEEPAQLEAVGELLDGCQAVVSFNGKQFDLPLIGAPHLVLLPTSRAFWKHRLASCALSSLEAHVLGVERTQEDVPGWLIPGLYFDYVRGGDAHEMPRIFYHNAQDILSLVTLAARQCALLTSPLPPVDDVPGEDLYGLGRFLYDLGEVERAEAALAQAASTSRVPGVREAAMRDLAFLLKRQQRRPEALAWWQALVETAGAAYACEELAKHYEWHDADLPQALAWTERALALVAAWPPGTGRTQALADLEHRRERLRAKLQVADEPC